MEDREEDESVMEDNNHQAEGGEEIPFQILVGGSLRGRCKLKDSKGYTYTVKEERNNKTWWRCSKRSKSFKCPASVIQKGNSFKMGKYPHEHPVFMKRCSRNSGEIRQPSWMNDSNDHGDGDNDNGLQDDNESHFTCSTVDGSNEDLSINSTPAKRGPSLKLKLTPASKKRKEDCDAESSVNVQDELIKIERERLAIDKQRLAIEKQRYEVEKQRLEETKKLLSQCTCMNQVSQPFGVLLQKNI